MQKSRDSKIKGVFMIKKFLVAVLVASSLMVIVPLSAFANAETHDGFYFNFILGGGYDQSSWNVNAGNDVKYSGTAYMFKGKIGGTPVENFIIYGVVGLYDMEGPKVTIGSQSQTVSDLYLVNAEFGGGFCYYFMPSNVYLAADLTASQLTIGNDATETGNSSDTGWGLTLTLGKEWWVSENWGMGLALIGTIGSVTAGEDLGGISGKDDKILHTYIGLALTATYN